MMKKRLSFIVLSVICAAPAWALIDDFDTARNFLTEGVAGTDWDAVYTSGGSSLQIESFSGKVRMQSANTTAGEWGGNWDMNGDGNDDVSPMLLSRQTGDFTAITRFAGINDYALDHQAAGLVARDPDNSEGENMVQSAFFSRWTGHITWNVVDHYRAGEDGATGLNVDRYCFMKMERVGNVFRPSVSQDGVNWVPMMAGWTRTDMPETVQVGLFHAMFSSNVGWTDFDFFYAGKVVAQVSGKATVYEEGQTSATLTVTLTGPTPTEEVQVKIIPYAIPYLYTADDNDPNDILLAGAEKPGLPLTLTFPVGTTQQTFTVQATEDLFSEGLEYIGLKVLTYSADANYNRQLGQWVLVTVIDNEKGAVLIDEGDGLVTDEDGTLTDSFSVTLSQPPAADVTLFIETDGQITVYPTSLTFTTDNYAVPQIVTVKAVDDAVLETDPHTGTITFVVSTTAPAYEDVSVQALSVTIRENECGAWGYSAFDSNQDCSVNLSDLAEFAAEWSLCTLPYMEGCVDSR